MAFLGLSLLILLLILSYPPLTASSPLCKLAKSSMEGSAPTAHPQLPEVTFAVSATDTIHYIDQNQVEDALSRAFGQWAAVIPMRFIKAEDYDKAFVKVGFYVGDHGDWEPFDSLGVQGHQYWSGDGRAHIHLNEHRRWAVDFNKEWTSFYALDLESEFLHLIGHLLGLGDSTDVHNVMYKKLPPRTKKFLTVDDITRVQAVCGVNPNFDVSYLPIVSYTSPPSPPSWSLSSSSSSSSRVVLLMVAIAIFFP